MPKPLIQVAIKPLRTWPEPLLLVVVLLIAFLARLKGITNPVADWHAWRQADTASVTREYVKHGVDLLHPKYHDISNIPASQENPLGYRMVEFPMVNAIIAQFLILFPNLPLVTTSRVFSSLASLGTLTSLYYLVKQLSGRKVALLTGLLFALLPYSMYYSRAILPEPYMLFFSTWSLMCFARWLKRGGWQWWLGAAVGLALALLLKPFVVFLAPVYVTLLGVYAGKRWQTYTLAILLAVLALLPLWWWRQWILQFPAGIPASDWLYNSNGIRLRPAWFRWLFWERLTKLMVGYVGLLFLCTGMWGWRKSMFVYWAWWAGVGVYLIVIATGNVQHDYYQNLLVPILCITLARGIRSFYRWLREGVAAGSALIGTLALCSLMWFASWQHVKGYYAINHWEYLEAGQAIDRLTPADALVIAPAQGDTQFLFQTNRRGWPMSLDVERKIELGATHYVSTSDDDEVRWLRGKFEVLEKGERYIIFDLTRPLPAEPPTP